VATLSPFISRKSQNSTVLQWPVLVVVAPRGGSPRTVSSPIAAFLASNLLAQFFFSFSRQKIIQIPYMALKKDSGNLAVRLL
jgi:hypothetical protein